jgi:hypothetical protein
LRLMPEKIHDPEKDRRSGSHRVRVYEKPRRLIR